MSIDQAHLDEDRGGWMTSAEADRYDLMMLMGRGMIESTDSVALFGGDGGVAAYLRNICHVASMTIVSRDHQLALRSTYRGMRGVELIPADPVGAMAAVIPARLPTVIVLDLHEALFDPECVRVLTTPLESVEVLAVIYGHDADPEQADGLDETIRTWNGTWASVLTGSLDGIGKLIAYGRP